MAISVPETGSQVIVDLPNERTTAEVVEIVKQGKHKPPLIRARLTKPTMGNTFHPHRMGDVVTFVPHEDAHRGTMWQPQTSAPPRPAAHAAAGR